MTAFKFTTGQVANDQITGFTGVITGCAYYIAGCRQYLLSPKAKEDGVLPDALWFDEERLSITGAEPVRIEASPTGGRSGNERAPAR